jgi:hypothetical protein
MLGALAVDSYGVIGINGIMFNSGFKGNRKVKGRPVTADFYKNSLCRVTGEIFPAVGISAFLVGYFRNGMINVQNAFVSGDISPVPEVEIQIAQRKIGFLSLEKKFSP